MYVFQERGITIHPPYKKLRPRNFVKGQIEYKEDKGEIKGLEKSKTRLRWIQEEPEWTMIEWQWKKIKKDN